jgi:acyl-CoA thioester hydrolase
MQPPAIPLENILALGPACLRMAVPDEYKDANGHMNMRWYLAIFDDAGEALHAELGLVPEFHARHRSGTVDLEHHINYLNEVMPGDVVAVYRRLVARSPKRLHYLLFMVNETSGKLAAIFECMNAFLDLKSRRTAPFPPEIAVEIAMRVARDRSLDWEPPVSGAMHV